MLMVNKMKKYIILIILFLLLSVSLFYFFRPNIVLTPINLNKNHSCVSDGMIIINYNGPKAQIVWKDGSRSFFCEVREAFYESLDKIKNKKIQAFYVQDFSNIEWGSYIDRWVLANKVYYVVDSDKDGAMGLTYVPFSDLNAAENFIKLYNGRLLSYNEINRNTLSNSSNLLKDRIIN
jgi:copper chaperone NosL